MSNQYSCGCGYNYKRSMQQPSSDRPVPLPRSEKKNGCPAMTIPGAASCCPAAAHPGTASPCPAAAHPGGRHPDLSLAMGYVPVQIWSEPLSPCKGLQIGTIFADLYKPFCGKRGGCR